VLRDGPPVEVVQDVLSLELRREFDKAVAGVLPRRPLPNDLDIGYLEGFHESCQFSRGATGIWVERMTIFDDRGQDKARGERTIFSC